MKIGGESNSGKSVLPSLSGNSAALPEAFVPPSEIISVHPPVHDSTDSPLDAIADEQRAWRWAALLTGDESLKDGCVQVIQRRLSEWLTECAAAISADLSGFPEEFHTTRFWGEVKTIESPLRFLKSVLDGLDSGNLSLLESIDHIGRNFGWDEERFSKCKTWITNLAGLRRWLPAFAHAQEYLSAAFPLGREKLDRLRETLLESIGDPHRFLQPELRNEFDEKFLEFKKNYIDTYFLLHEDALHVMGGPRKDELKVDSAGLRNLDLLSGLQYTDQSYLNRVKLLARWVQRNQCSLPLDQILGTYPRCYCNFNPCSHRQPENSTAQLNGIIQEGLEYFRRILRRCGHLIRPEIETHPDPDSVKQIMAVLNEGPMIPLNAASIKLLNSVIVKNRAEFISAVRKSDIR